MTPELHRTYSIPERVNGIVVDNYWKVVATSGKQRHSVYLRRHGTGKARRIGLAEFRRRAKGSPRG